jgi:diguanylate cyclase (GGDEF)-like protein
VTVSVRGDDAGAVVEVDLDGTDTVDTALVVEALEVLAAHAGVTLRNAELHERLQVSIEELSHRAHHDAMTGLANRAHLVASAERHLALAGADPGVEVALLFLDLDGFKPVNDQHGHEAGDAVLVEVARRLSLLAAPTVLPARLGGDEFAVLVTGRTAARRAEDLARLVTSCIERPFDVHGVEIRIGVSLGLAVSGRDGSDVDAMLRAADERMYREKASRSVVRSRA